MKKSIKKMGWLLPLLILLAIAGLILGLAIACAQPEDEMKLVNVFLDKDNKPPVLLAINSVASSIVRLDFDEQVKVYGKSFSPFSARADGKSVYVTLNSSLKGGTQTQLAGRVQDFYGNTTGLEISVWGYNPDLPQMVINEFVTKGTDDNPDRVELLALTSGNLAGMALYAGIPDNYDAIFVFEDIDVSKGDFVVVAFVDEESEQDSTKAGYFCVSEKRLTNDNGVLVLASSPSPGAEILDVVVYSKYRDGEEYFGTNATKEKVAWAKANGTWKGSAIDSTNSTSKRSMARLLDSEDTDTLADWYIATYARKEDGFGKINDAQAY